MTRIKRLLNIHDLQTAERAALMRTEWANESRFQKEFGVDMKNFTTGKAEALQWQVLRQLQKHNILSSSIPPLTELHKHIPQELKDYGMEDGVNKLSTFLYDTDEEFTSTYLSFMKECVGSRFPYPFYFQKTPTVRIHCPGGKNSNHYPRYHTDIGYGHPPQEINIWIPLTPPQGTQRHGFRMASVADSAVILEAFDYDFAPFINRAVNDPDYNRELNALAPEVETPFGQFIAFDSRCIHTGEPLLEHTRASIDVRIIPVADYNAMPVHYQGTGRRKINYVPGEAYYHLPSDQL
jgi:hypothetical protein